MQAPVAGADPAAGASAMPDPNAGMAAPVADPMAGAAPMDPTMGGDMNGDGMPDDPNAMGMDATGGEEGIDGMDVQGLYDSLPDEDKDAAEGYLKYLKRKNENGGNEQAGDEAGMDAMAADPTMAQQPMMETVIFTKKQLNKINEGVGFTDDERKPENKNLSTKKDKGFRKKSPFGAKKFGQSSL